MQALVGGAQAGQPFAQAGLHVVQGGGVEVDELVAPADGDDFVDQFQGAPGGGRAVAQGGDVLRFRRGGVRQRARLLGHLARLLPVGLDGSGLAARPREHRAVVRVVRQSGAQAEQAADLGRVGDGLPDAVARAVLGVEGQWLSLFADERGARRPEGVRAAQEALPAGSANGP